VAGPVERAPAAEVLSAELAAHLLDRDVEPAVEQRFAELLDSAFAVRRAIGSEKEGIALASAP